MNADLVVADIDAVLFRRPCLIGGAFGFIGYCSGLNWVVICFMMCVVWIRLMLCCFIHCFYTFAWRVELRYDPWIPSRPLENQKLQTMKLR